MTTERHALKDWKILTSTTMAGHDRAENMSKLTASHVFQCSRAWPSPARRPWLLKTASFWSGAMPVDESAEAAVGITDPSWLTTEDSTGQHRTAVTALKGE